MNRDRLARYTFCGLQATWVALFAWIMLRLQTPGGDPPRYWTAIAGAIAISLGVHMMYFRREYVREFRTDRLNPLAQRSWYFAIVGLVAVLIGAVFVFGYLSDLM